MKQSIPKAQLILDYKVFYGSEPPIDRLSIIKNLSKHHVLVEFVGLNYRLKPKETIYIDQSFERQNKELQYFLALSPELHKQYAAIADKFTVDDANYPNI